MINLLPPRVLHPMYYANVELILIGGNDKHIFSALQWIYNDNIHIFVRFDYFSKENFDNWVFSGKKPLDYEFDQKELKDYVPVHDTWHQLLNNILIREMIKYKSEVEQAKIEIINNHKTKNHENK